MPSINIKPLLTWRFLKEYKTQNVRKIIEYVFSKKLQICKLLAELAFYETFLHGRHGNEFICFSSITCKNVFHTACCKKWKYEISTSQYGSLSSALSSSRLNSYWLSFLWPRDIMKNSKYIIKLYWFDKFDFYSHDRTVIKSSSYIHLSMQTLQSHALFLCRRVK